MYSLVIRFLNQKKWGVKQVLETIKDPNKKVVCFQ